MFFLILRVVLRRKGGTGFYLLSKQHIDENKVFIKGTESKVPPPPRLIASTPRGVRLPVSSAPEGVTLPHPSGVECPSRLGSLSFRSETLRSPWGHSRRVSRKGPRGTRNPPPVGRPHRADSGSRGRYRPLSLRVSPCPSTGLIVSCRIWS